MAALKQKVIAVLRSTFRELEAYLDGPSRTSRLIGIVVSPDFRYVEDEERQNRLWSALEMGLSPTEVRQLGPIATLTPAEASTLDRLNGTGEHARRRRPARSTSVRRKRGGVAAAQRA